MQVILSGYLQYSTGSLNIIPKVGFNGKIICMPFDFNPRFPKGLEVIGLNLLIG